MKIPKVFFVPLKKNSSLTERIMALKKIIPYLQLSRIISQRESAAIKVHIGEEKITTNISPEIIKPLIKELKKLNTKPFLIETTTLYSGPRSNAVEHIMLAQKKGFGADNLHVPFIIADGLLGNSEIEIEIPGIIYHKVKIAREAVFSDAFFILSHPTGHIASGFAACLKNLGMGLASRKGKLQQHSSIKPFIKSDKCKFCGECLKWCPVNAIIEIAGKAFIREERCIGCGECVAVCKFNAVSFNYEIQSEELQKRIAEYALGAISDKRNKSVFINFLIDMTASCDCMNIRQKPLISDIGILASRDPVAVDKATLDLTRNQNGKNLGILSEPKINPEIQLEHAEKIGLGTTRYELMKIQ